MAERRARFERGAAHSTAATSPTRRQPAHATALWNPDPPPPPPPQLPRRILSPSPSSRAPSIRSPPDSPPVSTPSSAASHRIPVKEIISLYGHSPTPARSPPPDSLAAHYPPLSPTPSSPTKSRSASPAPAGLEAFSLQLRPRAGSSASVMSASSVGSGRSRTGDERGLGIGMRERADSWASGRSRDNPTLQKIDVSKAEDPDALISFTSPVLGSDEGGSGASGWGSGADNSPSWKLHPPTPSTPHARTPPNERANSGPTPESAAPQLPPRRAATLTPESSTSGAPPALPPRPRPSATNYIPPPLITSQPISYTPRISRSSTTTAASPSSAPPSGSSTPTRHSRHRGGKDFESISLSSDGASTLSLSLPTSSRASSPPPPPPHRPSRALSPAPSAALSSSLSQALQSPLSTVPKRDPLEPKRRPMDPRSKARYEGLFNRCVEAQERGAVAKPAWVKRDERDELDALVVRGIWERSRLEKGVLRAVWCVSLRPVPRVVSEESKNGQLTFSSSSPSFSFV